MFILRSTVFGAMLVVLGIGSTARAETPSPQPSMKVSEVLESCRTLGTLLIKSSIEQTPKLDEEARLSKSCFAWLDGTRQKYCGKADNLGQVLTRFLRAADSPRVDTSSLPADDVLRVALSTFSACQNIDDELQAAVRRQVRLSLDQGILALENEDHEVALALFRPLARTGDRVAAHNFGFLLVTGRGVQQDFTAARSFFLLAAAKKYPPSFWSLGLMHWNGEGVKPDLVEAYKWMALGQRELERSTDYNDPELLAEFEQTRAELKARMSAAQLKEAEQRARKWEAEQAQARPKSDDPVSNVETLKEYNDLCQQYARIDRGIRSIDNLIHQEAAKKKRDLVTCVAFIEQARSVRKCDDREPILSEILYYTKALALRPEDAKSLPSTAAVASALVIGSYCEPSQPLPPGAAAAGAKLRDAYKDRAEITLGR